MSDTIKSKQGEPSYSESLMRPPANLNFLVWLILLGVPALLLFLIASKEYESAKPENIAVISGAQRHGD